MNSRPVKFLSDSTGWRAYGPGIDVDLDENFVEWPRRWRLEYIRQVAEKRQRKGATKKGPGAAKRPRGRPPGPSNWNDFDDGGW